MIINPQVPLNRLVLSLSEAMDHIHPEIVGHQARVAYISLCVGRCMGFGEQPLSDLFRGAALHDIGLTGVENRIKGIHLGQLEEVYWHGELGYQLLKDNPLFAKAADFIRFHHVPWSDGRGAEYKGVPVLMGSQVILLANMVERAIDRRIPVLEQNEFVIKQIQALAGRHLHPECVDAFCQAARAESFWLDVTSDRIYSIILKRLNGPQLTIDEVALQPIAEVFARLVDANSHWTAVHTAGVTASAVSLSQRLNFSPREQHLMRVAGYFHDLGKLAVPMAILDKPDKLNVQELAAIRTHTYHTFRILDTIGGMPQIAEWAAFHHERLDGKGYPFHHVGENLTLGSRIVAVADVFTAIIEDRPYRKGMTPQESLAVLKKLVDSGGLDGVVVGALERDFGAIDEARRDEQAQYLEKQKRYAKLARQMEESFEQSFVG